MKKKVSAMMKKMGMSDMKKPAKVMKKTMRMAKVY